MADDLDSDGAIDWDQAFTQVEACPSSIARTVEAVKDALSTSDGSAKIAIAYEGGESRDPPTSSDVEVATALGGVALDKLPSDVVGPDGRLDEVQLVARLEAERKTLFERFRRSRNRLSVSDLVSPSWCEQQYYYGLIGRRNRRVENRPTVIIVPPKPGDTGPPRQIVPDQQIALARDAVLKKGNQVHAKLEKELAPMPAQQIAVDNAVDRMGVHLLDLCAALNSLLVDGKAREIPLWGYINGFEVAGIVDEVQRRALPHPSPPRTPNASPAKGKRKKAECAPDQKSLDAFFGIKPLLPPEPVLGCFLIDHKSRASRSLPSSKASVAGRLQVSVYKRMWDEVVTGAFSWTDLFTRRRIRDASTPFSAAFLEQTAQLRASVGPGARLDLDDGIAATSLDELVTVLQRYFTRLGQVQNELALVYIFRERASASSPSSKHSKVAKGKAGPSQTTEDTETQRATEASLRDSGNAAADGPDADEEQQLRHALAASLEDFAAVPEVIAALEDAPAPPDAEFAPDEESQVSIAHAPSSSAPASVPPLSSSRITRRTASAPTLHPDEVSPPPPSPVASSLLSGKRKRASSLQPVPEDAMTAPSSPTEMSGREGKVIGSYRFQYDAFALDAHLADIAAFWRSEREPRGIALEDTWKCRTCEYADGCEWLESKAKEAAMAYRQSKAARDKRPVASSSRC